jgi:DNA-binding response OmpR family regulator
VTKPFSPAELVSRVKAVLRRSVGRAGGGGERPLSFGDLTIDPNTRLVTVRGENVELTATEFNLLWFMACHPRQVFKRDQLLENVWGFPNTSIPAPSPSTSAACAKKSNKTPGTPPGC